MLNTLLRIIILSSALFISACASKLSQTSPSTVDLSGTWELNPTYSQDVVLQSPRSARGGKGGGRGGRGGEGGKRGGRGGGKNGDQGGPPRGDNSERRSRPEKTNAMKTTLMTITQNNDSMGIAYKNQDYRDVEWGKTEQWNATTTAGWNNQNQLIIETDTEKNEFIETYTLKSNGSVLELMIDVNGNERGGEYRRVFMRKEGP